MTLQFAAILTKFHADFAFFLDILAKVQIIFVLLHRIHKKSTKTKHFKLMKFFTSIKTMAVMMVMLLVCNVAMAGNGTKDNPYTPAELNAQKEALKEKAMSMLPFESNIVWVRADLKGLGEDGQSTVNATTEQVNPETGKTENVYHLAGLFGNGTGEFVAYSWQILGEVAMEDFTNTEDLLIALTYQQHSHTYANRDNPWQGQDYEPDDFHFSLVEVYGALSVEIKNGYRGFHMPACYVIPEGVCATTVNAGVSNKEGAYVKYRYYDGASEQAYVTPKNSGVVLMAKDGIYDFVLTTDYYEPVMASSNALYGGTQAGTNAGTKKNRTRLRFVNDGTKCGFQKNSDENCTVILDSKDEVFLEVSSAATNFGGKWNWETEAHDWITWGGGSYEDQHATYAKFDFTTGDLHYIGETAADTKGWIYDEKFTSYFISLEAVTGTSPSKNYADNNRGNCFVFYKDGLLTVRAPKGMAVTKVEFEMAGNSNVNKLSPSTGSITDLTWTGNAEGVRFTQGATSYLASVAVTVADKNEETSILPDFEYVDCQNIAEFNALADGQCARVRITDAQVIGKSADGITTAWIQDVTGGAAVRYSSIVGKLEEGKRVFGSFTVKKSSNMMRETEGSGDSEVLPQDMEGDYYIVEGTIADINVPENLNRLVKITGAAFAATSATAGNLTQDNATIGVNNGAATAIDALHKIEDTWVKGETTMDNVTILAILSAKNATTNQLLPITMLEAEPTGVNGVEGLRSKVKGDVWYDLQGRKFTKKPTVKGLYIVGNSKIVID